jgi:glycosyltransferase involved in cell wall biosynthesis
MARLVSDEALRRRLAEDGKRNSERYTWDNAATEMWNSIMKTVNDKP